MMGRIPSLVVLCLLFIVLGAGCAETTTEDTGLEEEAVTTTKAPTTTTAEVSQDNAESDQIEFEIVHVLTDKRADGGKNVYVVIDSVDLSDDGFKDNVKQIIREIIAEYGPKVSIEIHDASKSLEISYKQEISSNVVDRPLIKRRPPELPS